MSFVTGLRGEYVPPVARVTYVPSSGIGAIVDSRIVQALNDASQLVTMVNSDYYTCRVSAVIGSGPTDPYGGLVPGSGQKGSVFDRVSVSDLLQGMQTILAGGSTADGLAAIITAIMGGAFSVTGETTKQVSNILKAILSGNLTAGSAADMIELASTLLGSNSKVFSFAADAIRLAGQGGLKGNALVAELISGGLEELGLGQGLGSIDLPDWADTALGALGMDYRGMVNASPEAIAAVLANGFNKESIAKLLPFTATKLDMSSLVKSAKGNLASIIAGAGIKGLDTGKINSLIELGKQFSGEIKGGRPQWNALLEGVAALLGVYPSSAAGGGGLSVGPLTLVTGILGDILGLLFGTGGNGGSAGNLFSFGLTDLIRELFGAGDDRTSSLTGAARDALAIAQSSLETGGDFVFLSPSDLEQLIQKAILVLSRGCSMNSSFTVYLALLMELLDKLRALDPNAPLPDDVRQAIQDGIDASECRGDDLLQWGSNLTGTSTYHWDRMEAGTAAWTLTRVEVPNSCPAEGIEMPDGGC